MKRFILLIFVAVGLLTTFTSCTKEESTNMAPSVSAVDPLDPDGFGFYEKGEGELYYYNDKVTSYSQVKEAYLKLKPLNLEKYKHGEWLDSVCNKDIAFVFENKGRLSKDKSKLWALRPRAVDPYPPFVTINTDWTLTIKMSKMVHAVGIELNSLYQGTTTGITVEYFNTELNKIIRPTFTIFIDPPGGIFAPLVGETGGAALWSVDSETPFNEIRIRFGFVNGNDPVPVSRYDLMLAGFRYKLAE
jgi:hypothetical protein